MFTRVAASIGCEGLSRHHKPKYVTTTDFCGAMAAERDRAAISLVISARPRLPAPKPQRTPRA